MRSAPDSTPICAPDSFGASEIALDSGGVLALGIGAAADFFCAAKAAEGASPRTVEWYRMILIRAVRRFGEARPVDGIPAVELRAWLLELRSSLAPESVAGYVRGLKAFGNWCVAEELASAAGFRALRRPHVPRRLIAPFSDAELRSLLAVADERERALVLLLFDTGLRLSELVSLRVGGVRPDGTLHVMGKGTKERIVPLGSTARRAFESAPRPFAKRWPIATRRTRLREPWPSANRRSMSRRRQPADRRCAATFPWPFVGIAPR